MNFEEYIKSQKEALHTETPSFLVWNTIQKELAPKRNYYKIWAIAASVILVAASFIFYFLQNKKLVPTVNIVKENIAAPVVAQPDSSQLTTIQHPAPKKIIPPEKSVEPVTSVPAVPNKQTSIAAAQKTPAPKANTFQGQNFYDSTILALKQKIEATPVKWVDQNYFTVYLTEYKNLETEENEWKKKTGQVVSETDFIIRLIQINQQKIEVLANLLKQIKNINTKKGDTAQTNYNKIII